MIGFRFDLYLYDECFKVILIFGLWSYININLLSFGVDEGREKLIVLFLYFICKKRLVFIFFFI